MKRTFILLITLALMMSFFSCKKDKEETTTVVTWPDYSKLKTGNYWIYREYTVDSLGNATETDTYDSCFVEKDTLINNKTYFKLNKDMPGWPVLYQYVYLRDSLHYIVDAAGKILFSSQDFSTVFSSHYMVTPDNDTIYHLTEFMTDKNLPVVVPAETFITSNFKASYLMYNDFAFNGAHRYKNTRYAENVGIVAETLPFFMSNPVYTERRLVRYHAE